MKKAEKWLYDNLVWIIGVLGVLEVVIVILMAWALFAVGISLLTN